MCYIITRNVYIISTFFFYFFDGWLLINNYFRLPDTKVPIQFLYFFIAISLFLRIFFCKTMTKITNSTNPKTKIPKKTISILVVSPLMLHEVNTRKVLIKLNVMIFDFFIFRQTHHGLGTLALCSSMTIREI